MSRHLVLLLPLAAAAIVGMMVAVVAIQQRTGGQSRPADTTVPDTSQPAGSARPQLKPESNVCQGVLHRPDPGQPHTFPAMYTKRSEARGITIVADAQVSDKAIEVARSTIERLFRSNELAASLVAEGAYVVIADRNQGVLDLPEFGCLTGTVNANFFSHVCGVADRADYPVATANELDLTGDSAGPCRGLNILFHELGHLVQGWALEPADYFDIKIDYQAALDAGKYRRQYAATNPNEYFAEATQAYFLYGEPGGGKDREWLKQYDPAIYELLHRVYGE